MWLFCPRGQCRVLHLSPWNYKPFNAYNYAHMLTIALHTHTQGRFNNRTALSLYRIIVMATSVVGVMKIGNTVPRAGLETTLLAFWASVLPLHHVGSLMSQLYPHPPVYVALLPQRSMQTSTLSLDELWKLINEHLLHAVHLFPHGVIKRKESFFYLMMPLEYIDFHITGYWKSSIWSFNIFL